MIRRPPRSTRTDTLFPYTTRFRSQAALHPDLQRLGLYGLDCADHLRPFRIGRHQAGRQMRQGADGDAADQRVEITAGLEALLADRLPRRPVGFEIDVGSLQAVAFGQLLVTRAIRPERQGLAAEFRPRQIDSRIIAGSSILRSRLVDG